MFFILKEMKSGSKYGNSLSLFRSTVPSELKLLVVIAALAALIFITARRNEWAMRVNYLWKVQVPA